MSKFDAQSRYRLTETAQLSPGVDFLTKATQGPFVDTGLTLNKFDTIFAESNGARVYLSVATLREMAEGAGLFDELRAELLTAEHRGVQIGYADAMKENLGGTVSDLIERLGALTSRLSDGGDVFSTEGARPAAVEEPLVLVIDGPDRVGTGARADEERLPDLGVAVESNRPARQRRPAGVSAGASDGNPFRL